MILIKGGGGALLREKITAHASKRMIVIADSSKFVQKLGAFKIPVEVIPFALTPVSYNLKELGVVPHLRTNDDKTPTGRTKTTSSSI